MGLLQRALETYDAMSKLAGVEIENQETLAPVSCLITKASIVITINAEGEFVDAEKYDKKIPIPVTEKSAGRSGTTIAPHPLCDQLGYISPVIEEKFNKYCEQLKDWIDFDPENKKIIAIYKYITNKTIISDLEKNSLTKLEAGQIKNEKDIVAWKVIGLGEESGPVWNEKDGSTVKSFNRYYQSLLSKKQDSLCYLTGEIECPAEQHLKGVVSKNGNAKIISSNDKINYTYRGRFENDAEALTISYNATQKAHNALKWVVSNQGVQIEDRTFVCWNPHGIRDIASPLTSIIQKKSSIVKPSDYRDELKAALEGYKAKLPQNEFVVIAAFDAATSGRLAISYYNELLGSDFLDRLAYWDETCCWYDSSWGTYSPSLWKIVVYAFGYQRGDKDDSKVEIDHKIMGQHMQRLVHCRVDKARFPTDIMKALVTKAGNLQIYNKDNRRELLFITCAVIKKYRNDMFKEVSEMALEPTKKDRSYQYGRLLAIMEKAEDDVLKKIGENRETNAIKMQPVFVQRPAFATKNILEQLKKSYYPKLSEGSRIYYEKLIGEIMEIISECPESDFNKSLSETYLLGYYLQKNELYNKHDKNKENETEEE